MHISRVSCRCTPVLFLVQGQSSHLTQPAFTLALAIILDDDLLLRGIGWTRIGAGVGFSGGSSEGGGGCGAVAGTGSWTMAGAGAAAKVAAVAAVATCNGGSCNGGCRTCLTVSRVNETRRPTSCAVASSALSIVSVKERRWGQTWLGSISLAKISDTCCCCFHILHMYPSSFLPSFLHLIL